MSRLVCGISDAASEKEDAKREKEREREILYTLLFIFGGKFLQSSLSLPPFLARAGINYETPAGSGWLKSFDPCTATREEDLTAISLTTFPFASYDGYDRNRVTKMTMEGSVLHTRE